MKLKNPGAYLQGLADRLEIDHDLFHLSLSLPGKPAATPDPTRIRLSTPPGKWRFLSKTVS